MPGERGDRGEGGEIKPKITPMRFELAANTHLNGTNMLEALSKIKLETDDEGNIKENVVENIKTMLRTAAGMTEDEIAKSKFEKMLGFMQEY